MLQAMTTGQDGSLSTGHANTSADMLRRLETMVLMTGYELPLRAIREQIASAVDLIVHTARLKDGSRKIVNITEVLGIEDDEILMQDIFAFEQTGIARGQGRGGAQADRCPADIHGQVQVRAGSNMPADEYGIPAEDPDHPDATRSRKGRWIGGDAARRDPGRPSARVGRSRPAAWSTSRRSGRSIPRPVRSSAVRSRSRPASAWRTSRPSWKRRGARSRRSSGRTGRCAIRAEFDTFNEEWVRWFPGDAPIGQGTLMPTQQQARRLPGLDRGHRRGIVAASAPWLPSARISRAGCCGSGETRSRDPRGPSP